MRFELVKKERSRYFIIGLLIVAGIFLILNLAITKAKYQITQSIPLVSGKISYKLYDFKMMAMYQENHSGSYDEIEKMPSNGYVINEEKSYCKNDSGDNDSVLYTNEVGEHVIANLNKNDKCYLYFDIDKPSASEIILANKIISTRNELDTVYTATNTSTLFTTVDDDGTTYYFAGAPTDNWVKFAGFYWRIVRINGDGTIRIIYNGTSTTTTGTSTQIATSGFSSSHFNNAYVGYMYTIGDVRGLGSSSNIKETLETWFVNNLSSYANYIDQNAGFCGDRTPSTSSSASNGSGGTGSTLTYYAAYIRLKTNNAPSLKCVNSLDLYTASNSKKGNKALSYPIGLITADEGAYAGGVYDTANSSYYLYSEEDYWTISPGTYDNDFAGSSVFFVGFTGDLSDTRSSYTYGARPVINLRADVSLTGNGMKSNPYLVS